MAAGPLRFFDLSSTNLWRVRVHSTCASTEQFRPDPLISLSVICGRNQSCGFGWPRAFSRQPSAFSVQLSLWQQNHKGKGITRSPQVRS